MKTLAILSFLFSICLLAGCDSDSLVAPESVDALSFETLTPDLLQSENAASKSNSNVYTFADMELVGSSDLTRKNNGVSFNLKTTMLDPGSSYTLWMVVFNNPEECGDLAVTDKIGVSFAITRLEEKNQDISNNLYYITSTSNAVTKFGGEPIPDVGCIAADLDNPAVQGDVLYSAGSLAGGTGKATFAGNRKTGDNSGSFFQQIGLDAPGIIDSRKAEIHFVVRTHGEKIPGLIREQISTINGGCEEGQPNEGDCDDVQFAVHHLE